MMRLKTLPKHWKAAGGYLRMRTATNGKVRRSQIDHAETLALQLSAYGIDGWVREHMFHGERRWRIDVAFIERKLAIEVEGFAARGTAGRHQRADGFAADAEKYAELAIAGWRLIRCTSRQVKSGKALAWIERALA